MCKLPFQTVFFTEEFGGHGILTYGKVIHVQICHITIKHVQIKHLLIKTCALCQIEDDTGKEKEILSSKTEGDSVFDEVHLKGEVDQLTEDWGEIRYTKYSLILCNFSVWGFLTQSQAKIELLKKLSFRLIYSKADISCLFVLVKKQQNVEI